MENWKSGDIIYDGIMNRVYKFFTNEEDIICAYRFCLTTRKQFSIIVNIDSERKKTDKKLIECSFWNILLGIR